MKQLLLSICLLIIGTGYAQQKKLKKIPFTKVKKEQQNVTSSSVFSNLKAPFGVEFREVKSTTDKTKQTHATYQQYYRGIKVEMGKVKLHKKNGINSSYNGAYFDVSDVNTNPRISKQQAISIAEGYFNYQSVFWLTDEGFSNNPSKSIELVILPNRRSGKLNLAYAVGVGSSKPTHKMGKLYIDANTGAILKFKNGVLTCFENTNSVESTKNKVYKNELATFVEGTGFAAYSGSQTFETKLDGSNYVLNDETRATGSSWNLSTQGLGTKKGIITVDIKTGTDYVNGPLYDFTDADNNWKPAEMIANDDVYAIDVHWGTQIIYDYWKDERSWNSYNGSNSALLSIVHYDIDLTNASWGAINDNLGIMLYGDGGGSYSPLTTLDVIAHEIAHGVNNATSNLDYELESGALNEGLSDIWAVVFEEYADRVHGAPNIDYSRINDQNAGGAFRSLSNPNSYGQPDTYGGSYWYDVTNCTPDANSNDYCGVHTNSGVLNHWFWLLSQGGSGTNDNSDAFDVTAIGMDDAASIVWQMQTGYLTSTSDYTDARSYAIQSAIDLFGECSQQVQSVTNAFYAVGVGEAYAAVLPTITTQPENTTVEANNGTAQFTVVAENYDTVQWQESGDGGDTWFTISDNSSYSGAATTTLLVSNVPETNDLYYRAIVSNDCGNITSDEANLQSIEYTQIPDNNFEAALEALGYDDISGDNKVPTANIKNLTSLIVTNASISDLSGIEDFQDLETLNYSNNSVKTVDLSNNSALRNIVARYNGITTTIDVSANTALEKLFLENNSVTSIDVSNNPNLIALWVQNNNLTSVDVSNNTALTALGIQGNSITSLDVSNNALLAQLYAGSNAITSVDLSNNPDLSIVGLNTNDLSSLNIQNGNNTAITTFSLANNPNLTCILVDDAAYSTTNWTSIDVQTSFNDVACVVEYTVISDANFEAALEALGYDDISGDGQVPTSLIEEITTLDVSNKAISDLTGIEDFKSLEILNISNNTLDDLDFSGNSVIQEIYCFQSEVNSLDISNTSALKIVHSYNNDISTLNIDNASALEELLTYSNSLSSISFNNNTSLKKLHIYSTSITSVDLSSLVALEDLDIQKMLITQLDLSSNINLLKLNANDSRVNTLVLDNVASLEELYFENANYFTGALDLTSCSALKTLDITSNLLSSIDIAGLVNLEYVEMENTSSLNTIDFSTNTVLQTLITGGNAIEYYDLSNNTGLINFTLNYSGTLYVNLQNGFNALMNPISIQGGTNLCVLVDDVSFSTTNWTDVPSSSIFNDTYCRYTSIPDANFEAALETLGYDDISGDGQVPTVLIQNVTTLNIDNQNISDLTGIEDFTALENLIAVNNSLSIVDLTANTNLTALDLSDNASLSSLNLTGLTQLNSLELVNNSLTSLDVSTNTALSTFISTGNSIVSYNLNNNTQLSVLVIVSSTTESISFQNGNNTNLVNHAFYGATSLCMLVDDATYSATNWTNAQSSSIYSDTYCQYTTIPDANFEAALDALGYDDISCDGQVPTELIESVTNLSVGNKNISDFTGIEAFTSLKSLYVHDNPITSINLSNNINLSNFRALRCNLTSLDLSTNASLSYLDITNNDLTELNLANNTALTTLVCPDNLLSSLDVSHITVLEELEANNNLLTSLTLGTHNDLVSLLLDYNELTELDLSPYPNLEYVVLNDNKLTSLNLQSGSNEYIFDFDITNNPNLTCVLVDDATYSITNWTDIDTQTSFNETTCSILLATKIYLEGASINANTDEESLMRDDLRVGDYLPTTSPYSDALTCETTMFNTTDENAIVDWVWVELRNAADASEVINGRSALLQRDGDIVDVDGSSSVSFSQTSGDYYIVVSHRNHLSVRSAATVSLSSTVNTIDFTSDTSLIEGGDNAVVLLSNGKYALVSGDYDANGQIQNSDTSSITSNLGSSGYNDADLDMNGQVQNSDINTILNINLGKGEQF